MMARKMVATIAMAMVLIAQAVATDAHKAKVNPTKDGNYKAGRQAGSQAGVNGSILEDFHDEDLKEHPAPDNLLTKKGIVVRFLRGNHPVLVATGYPDAPLITGNYAMLDLQGGVPLWIFRVTGEGSNFKVKFAFKSDVDPAKHGITYRCVYGDDKISESYPVTTSSGTLECHQGRNYELDISPGHYVGAIQIGEVSSE